jgi:hypothetical protein
MQSAPTPAAAPDPVKTAAAQSASNKETAVAQYGLNATNQVTPNGSLNYEQSGTWADGTPRFTATTSLSPEQEQLRQTGLKTQQGLGDIGNEQIQRIGAKLNEPVDFGPKLNLDTDATEARTMELARKRLDPMLAHRSEAKKAELFNAGVLPGTEAYRRGMLEANEANNDATNQLILGGHDSAVRDITAEHTSNLQQTKMSRDQMFNEIASLLSGSQIQAPSFVNAPSPGIAPTDVIGAQQQALNQENVGFNAKQQSYMGMMNGMFGLGKTVLGGINSPTSAGGWSFGN